ncbi:MCP four helix bundle domain-containing protein, partial [Acinetobacter baumannii]
DRMVKVEHLGQFKDNINAIAISARNIVLVTDAAAVQREVDKIAEARRVNLVLIKELDESIKAEKARVLLQQITEARTAYAASVDRVIEARRA